MNETERERTEVSTKILFHGQPDLQCHKIPPSGSFLIYFIIIVLLFIGSLPNDICHAASNPQVIRVGSELDFPPYAFTDEKGQATGFSIELVKAVADAMGLSIKISTGMWDTMWNSLVQGRIDVLPIVAKLSERQRLVDFSLPHTETYDAFFVRKGDPLLPNIAAAKSKSIVVMRSDAAHQELLDQNFPGKVILVDSISAGLSLISSGKYDAVLCSKLIGTLLIKNNGLTGLAAGPIIPDYKRIFSFAVKKDERELLEKLNQGLLIVKSNGEYDRIYSKWLTTDDPWLQAKKFLLPAAIAIITIALIALLWLIMLHQLVKKRTRELAENNELLRHTHDTLEMRVQERTVELGQANQLLQSEITERKQVENALRHSEEKNREILESITDAFFSLDNNMVVKYFNPAAEKVLNRKADEVIGHRLFDVFPEARGSVFEENYTQCIRTQKALSFEVEFSVAPYENCYDVRVYPEKNGISVFFQLTTEHKRIEKMEKARLRIAAAINVKSSQELMQMALDEIEALTGSTIGFYHFILEDQETISLQTWSTNTLQNMCAAAGAGSHYPVSQGGVWTDCIRERRAVIHNDYNSLPHRKGMPPGHAPIIRELVVPIFRNERIVAILGVGNKPSDYGDFDTHLIVSLGDFFWEIVERKRIEEALRESEEQLHAVIDATPFPVALVDVQDNKIDFWSKSALTLFGHSAPTADEWYQIAYPDPNYRKEVLDRWKPFLEMASESGKSVNTGEYMITCRDGSVRLCELYATLLTDRLVVTFNDITMRKQAEEKIKASLREKEMLLKEIHHRVKNNLQIIASLLKMQTRYGDDEKLEGIFSECQDRIRAMANVHSMLYRSQNLAEVNFGEYIRETASQLLRSYKTGAAKISLVIHAEDVLLPIDEAIPSGLIINELVTNALKHAFPETRQGEIKIEMAKSDQSIRLLIKDNGIGFSQDIDFKDTKTMGLKLVNMLVKQLDGTIEQVANGGTEYVIVFKPQPISLGVEDARQ